MIAAGTLRSKCCLAAQRTGWRGWLLRALDDGADAAMERLVGETIRVSS